MAQQPVIAVFGGTGFLGRRIVRRLAASGARVRIVARRPTLPAWAGEAHTLDLLAADIRDEAAVTRAVQGADGVLNAVSLYVETRELGFDAVHVEAAALLATAAQAADVPRFAQVSGLGVDLQSPSPYVRARSRGEEAVSAAFPGAVMLRPSVIFGEGDAFLSALEGVTRLPVIPLFGRGDTRLQPVLVDDVAEAAARVLAGQGGEATVFELGGAEDLSYREIVAGLLRLRGRRRLLLPVPFAAWRAIAAVMKILPNPPLTFDQVVLMAQDNVVGGEQAGFKELGITPRGVLEWLAAHGE
jgi:uncharacterized protein YbjT (DUF2867 family)